MNAKSLNCVTQLISGKSYEEVSEEFGVSIKTLKAWEKDPAVTTALQGVLRNKVSPLLFKALDVYSAALGSENEWVRVGAARDLLNKFGDMYMGNDKNEITIKLLNGLPPIGIPKAEVIEVVEV